jgi:hypothetical protein
LVADFTRLIRQGGGRTRHGYVIREGLPPEAPLLYDLYDPEVASRRQSLTALGQVQRLADLADVLSGFNFTAEAALLEDRKSERGVPVIEGRNIDSDSRIVLDEIRHRAEIPEDRQLREGDLFIRTILGPGERIRVAEATKGVLPAAAGKSVLTLRLRPELSLAERQTLIAYLRSPHAAEQLNALRGETITIAVRHLSDLSVPLLNGALSTALNEIDRAIGQFRDWIVEAERARDALFEFSDPGKDGGYLQALGRVSRRRYDAARLVTDLRHRIRTQYPHPIAFRWRMAEVARPDLEGLQNVLECAEVAVCYLAFMAILLSRAVSDFRISYVGEISKRMAGDKPHGTNMGDWMAIVREVRGSKAITQKADASPFVEIAKIDEETVQALQRLAGVRNDVAHGRGPKGAAIPAVFEQCRDDLEVMLGGIEFVAEYPLRHIERASRDTLLGKTTYQFRELMGDHPMLPLSTATIVQAELEESLYLVDRKGQLHLLRPFLNLIECPECGRRATFYLDRYLPREGKCVLKSMEHEHTAKDSGIVASYRLVGLLPSK